MAFVPETVTPQRENRRRSISGDKHHRKKARRRSVIDGHEGGRRGSTRKKSSAQSQDKVLQILQTRESSVTGSRGDQMTTGQIALIEKKQKLYKESQAIPLWGIRKVTINPADVSELERFPENSMVTARYTWYSFLPKNLLEQFHRRTNIWFLAVAILQFIVPEMSNYGALATALPLLFILFITGLGDAWEDVRRHVNDYQQGLRLCAVISSKSPYTAQVITSKSVCVGHVLVICENDVVSADVVVLSTSNSDGAAYVDTVDLNGETELRAKYAVKETRGEVTVNAVGSIRGRVVCEQPSMDLDSFTGSLKLEAHPRATPLSANNFILKGSKLRNTDFIFGLVVYTGSETRMQSNISKTRHRFCVTENIINNFVTAIICILIFLMLVYALVANDREVSNFSMVTYTINSIEGTHLVILGFLFIVLLQSFVPILLMLTLDFIRFFQSRILEIDDKMTIAIENGRDAYPIVRSCNLSSTLGMVDMIFCDKTGTLTQNVMTFQMCVVGGRPYGLSHDEQKYASIESGSSSYLRNRASIYSPFTSSSEQDTDSEVSDIEKESLESPGVPPPPITPNLLVKQVTFKENQAPRRVSTKSKSGLHRHHTKKRRSSQAMMSPTSIEMTPTGLSTTSGIRYASETSHQADYCLGEGDAKLDYRKSKFRLDHNQHASSRHFSSIPSSPVSQLRSDINSVTYHELFGLSSSFSNVSMSQSTDEEYRVTDSQSVDEESESFGFDEGEEDRIATPVGSRKRSSESERTPKGVQTDRNSKRLNSVKFDSSSSQYPDLSMTMSDEFFSSSKDAEEIEEELLYTYPSRFQEDFDSRAQSRCTFDDERIFTDLNSGNWRSRKIDEFLKVMALCNTVNPYISEPVGSTSSSGVRISRGSLESGGVKSSRASQRGSADSHRGSTLFPKKRLPSWWHSLMGSRADHDVEVAPEMTHIRAQRDSSRFGPDTVTTSSTEKRDSIRQNNNEYVRTRMPLTSLPNSQRRGTLTTDTKKQNAWVADLQNQVSGTESIPKDRSARFSVTSAGDSIGEPRPAKPKDRSSAKGSSNFSLTGVRMSRFGKKFSYLKSMNWDPSMRKIILYQSYSPDEECLVYAASRMGYTLACKTMTHSYIDIDGNLKAFEIIGVNSWSSQRKRMSVVLRASGETQAVLYCKGADETILPLLDENPSDLAQLKRHIHKFSLRGLRSLVLCCRYLTRRETESFRRNYNDARASIYDKHERAEAVALKFENHLELLGVTGLKDKLQPGVVDTVQILLESGARLWMVTGDCSDYALHVAYSSCLIQSSCVVFKAEFSIPKDGSFRGNRARKEGFEMFEKFKKLRSSSTKQQGLCLVVNGNCLPVFLSHPELQSLFILMSCGSDAVICSRTTPAQKAQLVGLMRKRLLPSPVSQIAATVTLAVGNGVNDVSMMQAAHCGVAVPGAGGMEAVLTADYVIPQFSDLRRLLLVHGRPNFQRLGLITLWTFYKTILWSSIVLYYIPSTRYSAQSLFEDSLVVAYNLGFTFVTAVLVGLLDWDVPERACPAAPLLYVLGRRHLYLNWGSFLVYSLEALLLGGLIYYPTSRIIAAHVGVEGFFIGLCLFCWVTLAANLKLVLMMRAYNFIAIIFLILSSIAIIPFVFIRAIIMTNDTSLDAIKAGFSSPTLWLMTFLFIVVTWLLHYTFTMFSHLWIRDFSYEVSYIVRQLEEQKGLTAKMEGQVWTPDLTALEPAIHNALREYYNPFQHPGLSSILPKPRHFQLTDNVLSYAPFLFRSNPPITKTEKQCETQNEERNHSLTHRMTEWIHMAACNIGIASPRSNTPRRKTLLPSLSLRTSLQTESDEVSLAGTSLSGSVDYEGGVKGKQNSSREKTSVKVSDLIKRFTLRFKDQQLESEFKLSRHRETTKHRRWYRIVAFALIVTYLLQLASEIYSARLSSDWYKIVTGLVVSVALALFLIGTFTEAAFHDLETGLLLVLVLLTSAFIFDALDMEIGIALPAIFGTLTFVVLRMSFVTAALANGLFFVAFVFSYWIASMSRETIFLILPHFLGIICFTGFAGYRLEYNQRKRFLLNYQVEVSRRKQREILNTMLPAIVVEKMLNATITKDGIPIDLKAEDRGTVTVVFCDVYDFQNIVRSVDPTRLVEVLDSLFLCFDKCAEQFGCTKIETVFETYLAASGLRPGSEGGSDNSRQDAFDAVDMSLTMLEVATFIKYETMIQPQSATSKKSRQNGWGAVKDSLVLDGVDESSRISHHETKRIRVKLGMHSGRVISGVVGAKKPQYALFGDTVNTASRMKLMGEPDMLHVSDATHMLIESDDTLTWQSRSLEVKGKGLMTTYLLTSVAQSAYPYYDGQDNIDIEGSHSSFEHGDIQPQQSYDRRSRRRKSGSETWSGRMRQDNSNPIMSEEAQFGSSYPTPRLNLEPETSSYSSSREVPNNERLLHKDSSIKRKGRIQSALSSVQRSMRRVSVFQDTARSENSQKASKNPPDTPVARTSPKPTTRHLISTPLRSLEDVVVAPVAPPSEEEKKVKTPRRPSVVSTNRKSALRWLQGAGKFARRAAAGVAPSSQELLPAAKDEDESPMPTTEMLYAGRKWLPWKMMHNSAESAKLQLYLFTLSFRDREQEEEYKTFFYNNKSNISTIEQSLIIFLIAFVLYTTLEIIFDGRRYSRDTSQSFELRSINQFWGVRAGYTATWFTGWILFHYRSRPELQTIMGVRWLTFLLNATYISAACIFLISGAWAFTFSQSILEWLHTDAYQLVFFITIIHHSSGLLFQHVILVDSLLFAMVLVYVQIVCASTPTASNTLFLVFSHLLFNALAAHHKENTDRLTWFVGEEMQLTEDRARELLNDMLPKQVLEEFQQDKLKLAYRHDRMTFLFADICGFTSYANSVDATEVVQMLQQLFARFDKDSTRFGLYKLCTIGDAYVAVSEPVTEDNPDWNPVEGAERILEMAHAMIEKIKEVRDRLSIPGLNMRIGLHYGKCVGGVIGSGRLRYDLWGIDVLTANLIESNGMPGKINISEVLKDFLEEQFPNRFRFKFNRNVVVINEDVKSYFLLDGNEEDEEKIQQQEIKPAGRKGKRRFSVLGMRFGGVKEDADIESQGTLVEAPESPSNANRTAVRRGSITRFFGGLGSSKIAADTESNRNANSVEDQNVLTLEKLREMFQNIDLAEHGHDEDEILEFSS